MVEWIKTIQIYFILKYINMATTVSTTSLPSKHSAGISKINDVSFPQIWELFSSLCFYMQLLDSVFYWIFTFPFLTWPTTQHHDILWRLIGKEIAPFLIQRIMLIWTKEMKPRSLDVFRMTLLEMISHGSSLFSELLVTFLGTEGLAFFFFLITNEKR